MIDLTNRLPAFVGRHLVVLGVFGLLSIVHTWPMAADPAGQSLHWNHDAMQITWITTWVADHLFTAPGTVLDANVFHPAREALTYSDPMLVTGAMGAPLRWAGADAVLTHNLLWLLGFALSGFAMYLLVHHLTGDALAAVAAGVLFIFNSHVYSRAPHLMAIHKEWLPLAALALERLVSRPRARTAVLLGLLVAAAALSSGHLVLYTLIVLAGIVVGRAPEWWGRWRSLLPQLAAACATTLVVSLPLLHPWLGGDRSRDAASIVGAAEPASYLSSLTRLHYESWSWRFYEQGIAKFNLFPGVTASLLVVVAVWVALRRPRPRWAGRVPGYLLAAGVGVVLSFGHATPLYDWALAVFPPMAAVRAPGRFGFVFLTAVAVLGGLGMAGLRKRSGSRRRGTVLALALLLAVNVEAFIAPMPLEDWDGVARIYRRVATLPPGTVLAELPVSAPPPFHEQTRYMLNSTVHWKPLVNGYGSFFPERFHDHMRKLGAFPDAGAIRRLHELGVTHVVVHMADYEPGFRRRLRAQLRRSPVFRRVAGDADGRVLYRFRRRAVERRLRGLGRR